MGSSAGRLEKRCLAGAWSTPKRTVRTCVLDKVESNKWSLKINLFTKVFINRSVLIFGRMQPFFPKIMYISLLDRNDIFQWVAIR